MADLILTPNLAAADDVYAALLAAHEGLTKAESDALNARLILILLNHVGDQHLIAEAIAAARLAPAAANTAPDEATPIDPERRAPA